MGTIVQDTKNNTIPNIELYSIGTRPNQNPVIMSYSGTNCYRLGKNYIKKIKFHTAVMAI